MSSLDNLRGKFFVVEGTDGAGTTLQTQRLVERLGKLGVSVVSTGEPTRHLPAGRLIRSFLSKELPAPQWDAMALLFAADRVHHCQQIGDWIRHGITVVCDRYYLSSFIYQTLTSGTEVPYANKLEWIKQLNSHALTPDHTIVISVPANIAKTRREFRDGAKEELFEATELQERVCRAYSKPHEWLSDPYTLVDGTKSVDEVSRDIALALGMFE